MEDIQFVPENKIETCSNNVGFDYERKVTLLTALSAALSYEDFEMNTNVKGYTPLDDIELRAYEKGQETLYLVQIKHVAKPAEIQDNFFFCKKEKLHLNCEKRKGFPNFCLNKYNSKYTELTQSLGRKINFIFYTNYQFNINNNENCTYFLENQIEEDTFTLFLNSSSIKQSYKLHENKPELLSLQEEFRENSSFFFNQQNVHVIDDSIIHLLKQLNISEDLSDSIFDDLLHYFDNICSEIHKRPKITKKLTLSLVYFSCLFHLKIPFLKINNNIFENTVIYTPHLWNYLKYNKVILSEKHLKNVQSMIFNHENLNENNNDVYINILFKYKKLRSYFKNYFVECFRGSLPFLVKNENYKVVIDILKNFDEFQVIFIENNDDSVGSKFKDLSSDLCKELFKTEICQKNRKKCLVRDVVAGELDLKAILKDVTISDFLETFSSCGLEDDNKKVELERFVYFNELGTNLNDLINNHLVVFVNCNLSKIELVNTFNLKIFQNLIYDSGDNVMPSNVNISILNHNNYNFISNNIQNFDNHNILFVEINNQKLILKDYLGSIEDIKFLDKTNYVNLRNIPNIYQNNKLVIFSGVPGIGKSTAMNQLSTYISSETFVLLVNLGKKHEVLNKLTNTINCLEILKSLSNETNSFYLHILEFKFKKRDLCVILDGYDEIAPNFVKITNTLVKCILKENIRVILTTRTVLENQVETEFSSKSLTLRPFNIEEQATYLEQYFSKQNLGLFEYDIKNTCKAVIEKITNNIIGDEKFYSVPLHLEILSLVLLNLFQQNQFDLSQLQFEKLEIYKRFLETKIKAIQRKTNYFNIYEDEIKIYHQYFALKEIFPDIKINGAEEYLKVFRERLKKGSEKTGILINEDNDLKSKFIHRTIAEYYVALWLKENTEDDKCRKLIKYAMYKKENQFINQCLNSLLYGETSAYKKIISGEYDSITQDEIEGKYNLNRNIFHLLIINIDTNIKSKFISSKLEKFFKRSISKYNMCFKEEDYFNLTPIYYAEKINEINELAITIEMMSNNLYFYFNQSFNLLEFLICKNITNTNSSFNFKYGIDILLFVFNEINANKYNFIFLMESFDVENNERLVEEYKYGFGWLKDLGESINSLHCKSIDINSLKLSTFLLEKYSPNSFQENIHENPLNYAFLKNSYNYIELLMENANFFKNNIEIVTSITNKFIPEIIIAENEKFINYLIDKNLSITDLKIYSTIKQKYPQLLDFYKFFLKKVKNDKLGNSIVHLILLEKYNAILGGNNLNNDDLLLLLECLIENGYNINARNINEKSIIDLAIENNDLNILTFIINSHNYVQNNSSGSIKLAVLKNNLEITNFLLENKFDVNAKDVLNYTPLHWAVQNENLEMITLLINSGANVNASNNQQRSSLHLAAEKNKEIEVTRILLDKGADIEAVDENGCTPLLHAVYFENLEIVKLLINSGANINASNNQQRGPLHLAARENNEIEVTRILLDKGSDIEAVDENGYTPLLQAVYFENLEMFKLLINSGANIITSNKYQEGPLHVAAIKNKKIGITRILLDKGGDIEAVDENGYTPLLPAVGYENLEIVKLLINSGANINTCNNQQLGPLHIAAWKNKEIEVTRILLDKGSEIEAVDENGYTPLLHAVYFENLEIVKLLINSGANINAKNNQQDGPLHIAGKKNKEIEVISIILDMGADIEAVDENGFTPLLQAVYFENLEIVKLLINSGANINANNNQHLGLLHIAAWKNEKIEVTKILLDKGADIEAVDENGCTPLLSAVGFENLEIVKLLINSGANINASNNRQLGPLHIAAWKNKEIEVTRILLDKGSEIEAVDENGYTPLLHAIYFENFEIVKLLINSGANVNASNNQQEGPLHKAAERNKEIEITRILLNKGADIEAVDENEYTPLLQAVYFENFEVVKLLINSKANINANNNQQLGPLHLAAWKNKGIEVTKILLDKGANIETVDESGNTFLLQAVYFENLEIVKFLINSGANINASNDQQEGSLHKAAQSNKEMEVTRILLDKGADIEAVDENEYTPLLSAIYFENLEIFKLLISSGANINASDNNQLGPLHIAASTNKEIEVTRILLDKGGDIEAADKNGFTPLLRAVYFENLEIVKLLINSGANINAKNNQQDGPLHIAGKKNKEIEVISIILDMGADIEAVDENGFTPLLQAVYFENLEIVKLLINSGANINANNNQHLGLLHIAAWKNEKIEVTKILLDKGADIEAVDEDGYTPLMQAVYFENLEVVKILINSGANINASNNQQRGPLHLAARENKEIEVTKILLDKGADIEDVDKDGDTPLLCAVFYKNLKIVSLLLQKNANINVKNNFGKTPLDIALENESLEILSILLKYIPKINSLNKIRLATKKGNQMIQLLREFFHNYFELHKK